MDTRKPQVRTAVYLRISSDPTGQQLGVARQREDCMALAATKGWHPVEYLDNDISASTGKRRPAYEQMLADIREGRIGAVLAWDLDRLHRRPIELEAFMDLADQHHLALATVSGDVDLSTAQGRLTARLKGSVAAHETEHKRARQLRAAQQKAERGEPQWRTAFGYMTDGSRTPDPATAPLVKRVYAHVLAGGSVCDGVRMLNDEKAFGLTGKPWSPSTLTVFLRKPRNAGLRSYRGEIVGTGNWPPLVDEPTWRAVQAVLNAPGRAPGKKTVRQHLLTGVLHCGKAGCGSHLTGQWVMQRTGKTTNPVAHSITYACKKCHGVSIRAEHVEPVIFEVVAGRLAQPDAVDLLKTELHDTEAAEALRVERATLLARLDEIADERADGLLTGQQAHRATERITGKLAELDGREQDQERLRVFDGVPLGQPDVADALRGLTPDRWRAVIATVVRFTVLPVGKGRPLFNPDRVVTDWL